MSFKIALLMKKGVYYLGILIQSADRIFDLEIVICSPDRIVDLEILIQSWDTKSILGSNSIRLMLFI